MVTVCLALVEVRARRHTSSRLCVCWVIHVHDYVHVPGPVKGVQKVPKRLDIPYNVHISKERLVCYESSAPVLLQEYMSRC